MKLPLLPVQMGPADTDTNHSSAPPLTRASTSLWLLLPLTCARSIHLTRKHWQSTPACTHTPQRHSPSPSCSDILAVTPKLLREITAGSPTQPTPTPAASSVHAAVLGRFGAVSSVLAFPQPAKPKNTYSFPVLLPPAGILTLLTCPSLSPCPGPLPAHVHTHVPAHPLWRFLLHLPLLFSPGTSPLPPSLALCHL